MYALHRILVSLEELGITKEYLKNNREKAIKDIRAFADSQTQYFYGIAFDWRKIDDAGGWSNEYAENVLLGSENLELLLAQIQRCQKLQKEEINNNIDFIEKNVGTNLADIVEYAFKEPIKSLGALSALDALAKLLSGRYCFDSYFYDLDKGSARIDNDTLQKVKQCPEHWALVLFDYHN